MRVRERLDALYALGDGEGANRPGLGPGEQAAHDLVAGWMREAGLETSVDAAGNLYGRRLGRDAREIWVGSHLDSVPRGGRYDGALGVVAGLEAVERLGALDSTVAVVAFRDEEGWRFGDGFFGSRAVTGTLDPGTFGRTDAAGVSVADALAALGLARFSTGRWLVPPPAAYVELHIEQGPVLAEAGAPLGVVESIVGIAELVLAFTGREGHAGTTPMDARRDAGLAAAAFQVAAAKAARGIAGAVATVGWVELSPGAGNVIPGRARLVVDARAPDDVRLARLESAVRAAASSAAAEHGCDVAVEHATRTPPVVVHPALAEALSQAAPDAPVLPSGAGHDAQILGAAGVPVAMLFARSLAGGISHSPREATSDDDIAAAVDVLSRALAAIGARDVAARL